MLWGYFQKIVIADRIALLVDTVYGNVYGYQGCQYLLASVLFALQIYCDFCGYSTIAVGAAKVMGRAVSLAHLWNAVRVQGGAYGTGMVLRDTGFAGSFSYRDPSAARTLGCYRASADFLRGAAGMDLTGMIIGAVAESDPLLTVRMKGKAADARYWRRISHADACQVRREILSAVPGDLTALAGEVEALAAEGAVCVLGSRQQLDACGGELESVTVL